MDMEQWTCSKLGKEYIKFVYCHPVFFNIMWNAILDESQAGIRIAWEIITTSDMQMTESKEELKSLLMRVKKESEKDG